MEIQFYDKNIVICIKPVGIDSEHGMIEELKNVLDGEFFVVHRLDLNVGGLMVYARNKHTAAYLSKIIQENKMIKEYKAIVHGIVDEHDILEDFLFKDPRKNKVFVVKKERKGVKKAKLEYKRLGIFNNTSLVHIRLYTGRSHQIRVQFSSRGYPLVGDHKYGSKDERTSPLLYSYKLTFPYLNKDVSFESEPEFTDIYK